MNVLHHTLQYCPPSQTFVKNVVSGVSKRVNNNCVITHKLLESSTSSIHDISFTNSGLLQKLRQEIYKIRGYCHDTDFAKASKIANAFNADVVHCHFGTSAYFEHYLQKYTSRKKPMLISLHGYDVFLTDELYPDYRGVLCELSERADVLFTTPSTFLKQKFCSITEIPQDKVIVIPNSFDSAVFKENFIPLHNSQELKISNVGRFVDWKSQHILVRAASHLKKMGISNFSIDFVGDGPELSACKALAEELDVCNECNFWGSVPHSRVAAIVGGSHIYVHTATSNRKGQTETFGVAILEAVAMLKPVVYLDYGGIKEIFENDFSGLYLSSGSGAAELAGCISQTVSELQNLEARMVKNTALKILGKFEEDVVFHKIIETYTRLVIN